MPLDLVIVTKVKICGENVVNKLSQMIKMT